MVGGIFFTKSVTRVTDSGVNNTYKKQLEQYFERHDTETTNVMTNLAVLRTLIEHQTETKKFIEYAPSFLAISWYNAWLTAVVLLCSLLKTKSEGSLYGLLAFAETNQAQIFTKEVFEADAPLDGNYLEEDLEWKKINTKSPEEIITECRSALNNKKGDIDLIFSVRDKVYAHFDIISINDEQKTLLLDRISFGLLESLANLVSEVLNELHAIYDQKIIIHELVGSDDLLKLYEPLCFYEEHIEQAADEEAERIMSGANKKLI